jgi:hypothetical protein
MSVINLNKIRKKEVFDFVIKTSSNILDIISSSDDPLLKSLNCFISNNLGIRVDFIQLQRKYQILDDIQFLFEERSEKITLYDLDKLEIKMCGLDRNIDENIIMIKDFILENYNIHVPEYELSPSIDNNQIIDYIMERV